MRTVHVVALWTLTSSRLGSGDVATTEIDPYIHAGKSIVEIGWNKQRLNDRRVFRETHIQRQTGNAFFEEHKNVRRPKERDTGLPKKTAKTAKEVELNGIV